MNVYYLFVILNFCIVIPGITALIRFDKINITYRPFFILIWLGIANECVSAILIKYYRNNLVSSNIYSLAEAILIAYQFNKFKLFLKSKTLYRLLIFSFVTFWIVTNFFMGSLTVFNSNFLILYSFVIVLMSVSLINTIIIYETSNLLKNPEFILCICFIIFFAYSTITELTWKYGTDFSDKFKINVRNIFIGINLFNNILFTYAILCMRKKIRYSNLY